MGEKAVKLQAPTPIRCQCGPVPETPASALPSPAKTPQPYPWHGHARQPANVSSGAAMPCLSSAGCFQTGGPDSESGRLSVADLGVLTRSGRRPGRPRYACGAVPRLPSQPPSAAVLLRLLGRPKRRYPAVNAGGRSKRGSSLQANLSTAHRSHLIFLMSHPWSAQYLGTVIARWPDAPKAAGWRDWAALHAARVPGHDGPRSPSEAQAPPAFSGAPAGGDTLASCASMAARTLGSRARSAVHPAHRMPFRLVADSATVDRPA